MLFENKTVLITGGSSGIGRACALHFAKEGANIMIADVDADGGAETVAQVEELGGTIQHITTDMRDPHAVKVMVDATVQAYGSLDVAVNNAGVSGSVYERVQGISDDTYNLIMDVNVKGVWLCLKYQIPEMLKQRQGSIINMASVAGLIGAPKNSVYAASKHAVIGLTKSVALETASKNIRVNAVCPSYIETPMVTEMMDTVPRLAQGIPVASPMRRLGTPDEIANVVVWLASEQASFVNGATIAADGGLTAS